MVYLCLSNFYLLTPFLYNIFHNNDRGLKLAIIFRLALMMVCQYEGMPVGMGRNVLMGFVRVPSFILGISMTKYIMDERSLAISFLIFYTIIAILVTSLFKILFPMMYTKWVLVVPIRLFLSSQIKKSEC